MGIKEIRDRIIAEKKEKVARIMKEDPDYSKNDKLDTFGQEALGDVNNDRSTEPKPNIELPSKKKQLKRTKNRETKKDHIHGQLSGDITIRLALSTRKKTSTSAPAKEGEQNAIADAEVDDKRQEESPMEKSSARNRAIKADNIWEEPTELFHTLQNQFKEIEGRIEKKAKSIKHSEPVATPKETEAKKSVIPVGEFVTRDHILSSKKYELSRKEDSLDRAFKKYLAGVNPKPSTKTNSETNSETKRENNQSNRWYKKLGLAILRILPKRLQNFISRNKRKVEPCDDNNSEHKEPGDERINSDRTDFLRDNSLSPKLNTLAENKGDGRKNTGATKKQPTKKPRGPQHREIPLTL